MSNDTLVWITVGFLVLAAIGCIYWIVAVAVYFVNGKKIWQGPKKQPAVTHGPIGCPFCNKHIVDDVSYTGQSMSCPHCHGQFRAPSHTMPADIQRQIASGLIAIASGACVFWLAGC